MYDYSTVSISLSWDVFVQPVPLQLPQARVHSMLCFLHEYLNVLQSVWQLHLITHSRCSGAGGSDDQIGTNPFSHSCHPQFIGSSFIVEFFHSWTWRYTQRLWYFAAAEVGGSECGFAGDVLKLLFHKHCLCHRDPLYISTRAFSPESITSCVEAASEWNTFACSRNKLLVLNLLMAAPFLIP